MSYLIQKIKTLNTADQDLEESLLISKNYLKGQLTNVTIQNLFYSLDYYHICPEIVNNIYSVYINGAGMTETPRSILDMLQNSGQKFKNYDIFQNLVEFCSMKLGPSSKGLVENFKLSCTCGECNLVRHMIMNSKSDTIDVKKAQSIRTHVEGVLRKSGIVTHFSTIRSGSPHTLRVQFLPDFGYDKIRIELANLRTQKRSSGLLAVDVPPTKRNFLEIND